MKSIIFGAGSDLGVHIDGAHLGPVQLINDLQSFYKGEAQSFTQDENIIKSRNLSDRRKNEYEVEKFNTVLYNAMVEKIKQDYFPILLGGDHSVVVASALASLKVHGDLGIIWIDAHTDYNTFETTITGNIHGLPLAAINGYKCPELRTFHDGNIIQPVKTVVVGARSIDKAELENIKYSGITVFTTEDIKELRNMEDPYHILEPYGILDAELWDADGRHWQKMRDYLEELKDRHYCILGNLSNGGDPNIDIICSHYQVYFLIFHHK